MIDDDLITLQAAILDARQHQPEFYGTDQFS